MMHLMQVYFSISIHREENDEYVPHLDQYVSHLCSVVKSPLLLCSSLTYIYLSRERESVMRWAWPTSL